MYIIALEIARQGNILGTYENFEDAKCEWDRIEKRLKLLSHKAILINHKEEFQILKTYEIKSDFFINRGYKIMSTDGEFSSYVIELGNKWDTLDSFIADRSFQTEMFLE